MARTFLTGFLLGWSVAWPPGPINAEAIRRGLTRGFWAAYLVVIGGCAGDATWAVLASLAADRLRGPRVQLYLGVLSVVLLIFLALIFFRGAWRECRQPLEKIERDVDRDYIMDARQAMEYGMIDHVITKRELPGNVFEARRNNITCQHRRHWFDDSGS